MTARDGAEDEGTPYGPETSLNARPVPATGEMLPVMGLGTWKVFDVSGSRASRAPLEEVLRDFAALGGRLVDTSPMYGRSEEVIGDIAATLQLRDRLFLATKVWTTGTNAGVAQMRESFRKLRASQIDLMQVHNLVDVHRHLETLRAWKQEGLVRYVGITHYTASAHDEMARLVASHALDFIQINYSAVEREAEGRLLPLARDRGVAVIANRPLASGALLRRLRERALPEWAAEIACRTWGQLLLKFVVAHPAVTCAIPATSNPEHLRENMGAAVGLLPDEPLRERIIAAVTR